MTDPNESIAQPRLRDVVNKDGMWWYDAPAPPTAHDCSTHTFALADGIPVHRCACGAVSGDGATWTGRNSRRDDKPTRGAYYSTIHPLARPTDGNTT